MKRTWAGIVALLSLFLAGRLAAQPAREFQGQVFHLGENGERVFERGLIITFVVTGTTDDTNDQGIFRLPLPPAFQPGSTVKLSIDKPGWRIRYPLDGEARVPQNLLKEIVPVELLPVGSKLFWTHDRIEKFIRDVSERSKQEGKREDRGPSLDLGREIKEWAVKYGFSAQQAREEIDRWIAEVDAAHENNYQKGLAAFAKQQFDTAAERFRDSAEWRIHELDEARKQQEKLAEQTGRLQEEVVRDLRLQGDSHYYAHRFQQALAVYTKALGYTSKDRTPQLWAATLNDIGNAHGELGNLGEASESPAHLSAAVEAYRQSLLVYTHEQLPQDWATTQNNLGNALQEQGTRTSGDQGSQLLGQSVEAYRTALLVYTREQLTQEWATTQNNLGTALSQQGTRISGDQGAQLLAQSVDAYREALLVYTREQLPQQWAMTQNNLGNALQDQGTRMSGAQGAQLLAQSVDAYRQALLVRTREQLPQDWATTQNNLGNALREQGTRTAGGQGSQLLTRSVDAYRQALLVYTREQLPQQWAMTQSNLGGSLAEQGIRMSGDQGSQLLAQSVDVYRQSLLVRTREQLPQQWAMTQNNLGNALKEQGTRTTGDQGSQLLAQSVAAYRQSLLVYTREQLPQQWAMTQNNLGNALKEQGTRTAGDQGSQLLAQSMDAYHQSLLVYTREQLPQQWAMTQNNLGTALREQGTRMSGDQGSQVLAQAVDAYRQSLLVRTREQLPQQWAITQNNLGNTLSEQGRRTAGDPGSLLLAQSVEAYHQSLLVFTSTDFPQWWAQTSKNEARAFLALHRFEEATEVLSEVFAKDPDDSQAFSLLVMILNDRLFRHKDAVAVSRSWLSRHGDDVRARLLLVEQLFASRAFSECRQEVDSLLKDQRLGAGSRVVPLGYGVAVTLVTDASDLHDRFAALLAAVAAQPEDFETGWTFEGTLHSLGEAPEVSHKDWLNRLFRALEAPERDGLRKRLRELQDVMLH